MMLEKPDGIGPDIPGGRGRKPTRRDALQVALEREAIDRAEAFLGRSKIINGQINRDLALLERVRQLGLRVSEDPLAPPRTAGEASAEGLLREMARLEGEINAGIDLLVSLKNEIWCVLDRLENADLALILDDYYLGGFSMGQTAKRSGYTLRYLYKLRRQGLLEVARVLREMDRAGQTEIWDHRLRKPAEDESASDAG